MRCKTNRLKKDRGKIDMKKGTRLFIASLALISSFSVWFESVNVMTFTWLFRKEVLLNPLPILLAFAFTSFMVGVIFVIWGVEFRNWYFNDILHGLKSVVSPEEER